MIVFAVIALLAIAVAVWALVTMSRSAEQSAAESTPAAQAASAPTPEPTPAPTPLTSQIALPQFAWINLAADSPKQTQTFQNPAQNFAQFRVSIVLDGETLWESELLKPGETSAPVVLSRPLEAGEYEANLVYTCFTNDETVRPLNGANSPITLKVQ